MDDDRLPPGWAAAVAWVLVLGVVALAALGYRVTRPCWPWEETTTLAGGTFCDGEPARFTID